MNIPSVTGDEFRASHRVDTPPSRTFEDYYIERMNFEAYYKMIDGKGDHDCDHEH